VAERQGFAVVTGVDGEEAVELAKARHPDLILLDVEMPRRNGLEALEVIRETAPTSPSSSDERRGREVAEEALGPAPSTCPQALDERELRFVVERIRNVLAEEEDHRLTMPCLVERRTVLEIGNDTHVLAPVVSYLGRELRMHYPACGASTTEAKLALYEALANAIEHGNLEIDYDAKTRAMEEPGGIAALVEPPRGPPLPRAVRIEAEYAPRASPGPSATRAAASPTAPRPRPAASATPPALHGRGILLHEAPPWTTSSGTSAATRKLVRDMRPRPCDARA
jgi:hypothetical protein